MIKIVQNIICSSFYHLIERAPVNGGFSGWSEFTPCSHACDSGKQSRYRLCHEPFPKYGGDDCDGKLVDERECNTEACPGK